jgi:hypothetical protein
MVKHNSKIKGDNNLNVDGVVSIKMCTILPLTWCMAGYNNKIYVGGTTLFLNCC